MMFKINELRVINFAWIETLMSEPLKDVGQVKIEVLFGGQEYDFFPSSNTYSIIGQSRYGIGIQELCITLIEGFEL